MIKIDYKEKEEKQISENPKDWENGKLYLCEHLDGKKVIILKEKGFLYFLYDGDYRVRWGYEDYPKFSSFYKLIGKIKSLTFTDIELEE